MNLIPKLAENGLQRFDTYSENQNHPAYEIVYQLIMKFGLVSQIISYQFKKLLGSRLMQIS